MYMVRLIDMAKRNPNVEERPQEGAPRRNSVMESTMSVDEYFDELIEQVRQDYENV